MEDFIMLQQTKQDKSNLVWIDMEMTGLDPEKERIIEVATIVTDKDLNILEISYCASNLAFGI